MCLNIYTSLKQKNMARALFGPSGVAGLVLYVTACAGIVSLVVLKVNIFNLITIPLLIVLPLLSIFLAGPLGKLVERKKDWKPEKWGAYIAENIFEMTGTQLMTNGIRLTLPEGEKAFIIMFSAK